MASGDASVQPAMPALTAALYGRVVPAIRHWLGQPELEVDVEVAGPDDPRLLERDGERVRVGLPFAWVPSVWAMDLTTLLDRFVLTAEPAASGSSLVLTTIGRAMDEPRTLTLHLG